MFKTSLGVIAVAGLAFFASAATADPTASTTPVQAAAAPAATEDLDKVECRSLPPETGTRIGARRQCRTIRDWNELRDRAQKALNDVQSHGLQKTLPGG